MTRLLIPAAIASLLLLVAITVVLAHLNWSEKLYNPLLSLAFVGTATAFVTILLPLKGSQNETEFTTSVVVDETSHTLPLIMPDGRVTRVMNRLGELSSVSRPTRGTGGDTRITVQPPNTTDETFRFCGQVLQYAFVHELERLQRPSAGTSSIRGPGEGFIVRSASHTPFVMKEIENVPVDKISSALRENPFSDSQIEEFYWEHSKFSLPPDTRISLALVPGGEGSGPEKYVIKLEKPRFFSCEIVISGLFSTGHPGTSLPDGITVVPDSARGNWQTYTYQVRIIAKFEKLTSGNWRTEEYKGWTSFMTAALEQKWSDAHNNDPS
jgi:hypothetical protein